MTSDPRVAAVGTSWCRAEQVLWRRTLDGVVLLAARAGSEPVALRGPAAEIWELLAAPMRADEIVAALAVDYRVGSDAVADDVSDALLALSDSGALCRR